MNRLSLLWGFIVILAGCRNEPSPGANTLPSVALASYPYHFEEGTGSRPMIEESSVLKEITFDEKRSEPEALATLRGLNAEVLYPNASGKITLQGKLDSDGTTFVLRHWYLPLDFIRVRFAENASEDATELKPGKLTPDDFKINLREKAPHFSEQKYLQPLR